MSCLSSPGTAYFLHAEKLGSEARFDGLRSIVIRMGEQKCAMDSYPADSPRESRCSALTQPRFCCLPDWDRLGVFR